MLALVTGCDDVVVEAPCGEVVEEEIGCVVVVELEWLAWEHAEAPSATPDKTPARSRLRDVHHEAFTTESGLFRS